MPALCCLIALKRLSFRTFRFEGFFSLSFLFQMNLKAILGISIHPFTHCVSDDEDLGFLRARPFFLRLFFFHRSVGLVEWYIRSGVVGIFSVCQSSEMYFVCFPSPFSFLECVVTILVVVAAAAAAAAAAAVVVVVVVIVAKDQEKRKHKK